MLIKKNITIKTDLAISTIIRPKVSRQHKTLIFYNWKSLTGPMRENATSSMENLKGGNPEVKSQAGLAGWALDQISLNQ